jgi:hypothetical protein
MAEVASVTKWREAEGALSDLIGFPLRLNPT